MRTARFAPLAVIAAGAIVFFGAACGGGGGDEEEPEVTPTTAAESPTATRTATPTRTPEPPTPTPTATPFDGKVARLSIPKFGVDAPIEELGLTPDNYMDTPKDENRAVGWYYPYDKPGWRGNALFSAHVYYNNVPAPFVNLARAVPGDEITVTMEDGTQYTYTVFENQRYHRDNMPMGEIIWPPDKPENEEWITLITCGGELDSSGWEYLSRDVIIAKRILT